MPQPLEDIVEHKNDDGSTLRKPVPALDPHWLDKIEFLQYIPPPLNVHDRATVEQWLECTNFIQEDLDVLLRLPHKKFWCHAVFDSSLHKCIDSYLHHAPRSYDIVYNLPRELKERQETLHRLFFMVCLRMATHKESKDTFISPNVFGEIIYENFLFDIPKIMDLCVLYGDSNGALLFKMIQNIFTQQPKYKDDWHGTVPTIAHILETICEKCGVHLTTSGSPKKIGIGQPVKTPLLDMPVSEFQDVIFYISDTTNTLWSFLMVYPVAAKLIIENGNIDFAVKLANFYEVLIPTLIEAFEEREWEESLSLKSLLVKKMHQSQVCLIKIFRQILSQICRKDDSSIDSPMTIGSLLDLTSEEEVAHSVEEYMTLLTAILNEKRFLAHFNYLYPFPIDREIIEQSNYDIDETRLQFIQDAVSESTTVHIRQGAGSQMSQSQACPQQSTKKPIQSSKREVAADNSAEIGACAAKITGIELQSMISSVKDLLPELGEGFIELCLEELGYDIEKVINGVLEDKLPDSLQKIDRTMGRDVNKVSDEMQEIESLLDKRLNVYDGDEFDAFKHQIDKSKVITGKKEKTSLKDLDDKSHVASLKPLYDKYGSAQVESMYEPEDYDYEDEYDDTYDSNLVGADDADSADELTTRRQFVIPRVLQRDTSGSRDLSDEEEEEDNEPVGNYGGKGRPMGQNFLEDPAVIRQRQEERRQARQGMRGGGRGGRGGNQQQQKPREYDVTGKPKGQGQDKETLKNRAWKEKNKATRVHHNRKNIAARKGGGF